MAAQLTTTVRMFGNTAGVQEILITPSLLIWPVAKIRRRFTFSRCPTTRVTRRSGGASLHGTAGNRKAVAPAPRVSWGTEGSMTRAQAGYGAWAKDSNQRSTTVGKANRLRRRLKEKARKGPTSTGSGGAWSTNGQPTLQERAAVDVMEALRALAYNDTTAFQVAFARVAGRSGSVGWRRSVERLLADHLQSVVSEAWHHGWQPADLVRVVTRRLSRPHVALTGDAIAAQMQRYTSISVDPRWTSQLADLEVQVWRRPDQNHLAAMDEAQNAEWATVVSCALEVLNLIAGLPWLEKLIPIPGTARATDATAHRAAIDERVLGRIRALLAKAESSTFPAEAETFTAGAQSLMARHSIDHALLSALDQSSSDQPVGRRIGIDNPYEAPKAMLLTAVAEANRCRTVWSRELGFSTVVGFAADLDAVELLFTSLLVQATTAMMHAGSQTDRYGRSSTRSFRKSFLTAYASRIGQRLAEATGAQTTKAASEPAGRNLLPVLAVRSEAVD